MRVFLYEVLSYGIGDVVIGINFVIDIIDNIYVFLNEIKNIINEWVIFI